METKKMTIEVKFRANITDKDYAEVKKAFDKCGAEIISENFPEIHELWGFNVMQVATHD